MAFLGWGEKSQDYLTPIKEASFSFDVKMAFPKVERLPLKDLDLFPEITAVYSGGCGARLDDPLHYIEGVEPHISAVFSNHFAHTHMMPCSPMAKAICIADKGLIRHKDGTLSDIMWHEYGHVLTGLDFKVLACRGKEHEITHSKDWDDDPTGHGKRWKNTMAWLGRPDLQKNWINLDLSLFDIEVPYTLF
jgi:hypothetical protein